MAAPDHPPPNPRTPEATARLAWTILSLAALCFVVLCALAGYGLWRLRASMLAAQTGNTLIAYAGPVFRIRVGEEQSVEVPLRQAVLLVEGETVRVGESAPPGECALVTLWDGSTLQLYAGTRVVLSRLQATPYSDRFQAVTLELTSGQLLVGVAQTGRYQEVQFTVWLPGAQAELLPGGTYLLRTRPQTEVAVRYGRARVLNTLSPGEATVEAGERVTVQAGLPLTTGPAQWQLLRNGDFDRQTDGQELEEWRFRAERLGGSGSVRPVYRLFQDMVGGRVVWAVELERKGGTQDICTAILSQEVEQDLSPYRSIQLDLDLNLKYQGLPGGGPRGEDYPLAVRIRYRDAEGRSLQYLYGFYYFTSAGYDIVPDRGTAIQAAHDRWQHFTLHLLDLEPRPVFLNGVDLLASGQDYRSWVANVSLLALFAGR